MSRATLYVRFPDGSLRYGLYCGTTDIVWPRLYATPDQAWDAYDDEGDYIPGDGEPVDVATDYGGGQHWTATATREFVTSQHDWDSRYEADNERDGLPDWAVYPAEPDQP